MTQLTENVFAVEVPDGAQYHRVEHSANGEICELIFYRDSTDTDFPDEIDEFKIIDLPSGTWQLLCTTKEATEEQAKGIVEHDTFIGGYKDYDTERFHHEDPFIKATDSLNSLITSKGLDVNKNYVLLKKEKP